MKDSNLEKKLRELVEQFGTKPGEPSKKLEILAKQAQEKREKLQKSVSELQESLDFLRICIKYQLFDLEATRRENQYLRKLLEDKNS